MYRPLVSLVGVIIYTVKPGSSSSSFWVFWVVVNTPGIIFPFWHKEVEGDPRLETKRGDSNENCENCLWLLVHDALEVCGCDSPARVRDEAEMSLGEYVVW